MASATDAVFFSFSLSSLMKVNIYIGL